MDFGFNCFASEVIFLDTVHFLGAVEGFLYAVLSLACIIVCYTCPSLADINNAMNDNSTAWTGRMQFMFFYMDNIVEAWEPPNPMQENVVYKFVDQLGMVEKKEVLNELQKNFYVTIFGKQFHAFMWMYLILYTSLAIISITMIIKYKMSGRRNLQMWMLLWGIAMVMISFFDLAFSYIILNDLVLCLKFSNEGIDELERQRHLSIYKTYADVKNVSSCTAIYMPVFVVASKLFYTSWLFQIYLAYKSLVYWSKFDEEGENF